MPHEPDQYQGPFYTWWRGDPLPALDALPGLVVEECADATLLAELSRLDAREIEGRLRSGDRALVARLHTEPAAYGWAATQQGGVPELRIAFDLSGGDAYLWDFATLPRWRGHGLYPQLLQAMVRDETIATRFWIGHEPDNHASARGILKAGFQRLSELYRGSTGALYLVPQVAPERNHTLAGLIGVPVGRQS